MATHRNNKCLRIPSLWSDILMLFTVYTYAHKSDLDSRCILSGESSVRELVPVYNPGVTKNLKGITAKMTVMYKQYTNIQYILNIILTSSQTLGEHVYTLGIREMV